MARKGIKWKKRGSSNNITWPTLSRISSSSFELSFPHFSLVSRNASSRLLSSRLSSSLLDIIDFCDSISSFNLDILLAVENNETLFTNSRYNETHKNNTTWLVLMQHDATWWVLMRHDEFWWIMMSFDGSWRVFDNLFSTCVNRPGTQPAFSGYCSVFPPCSGSPRLIFSLFVGC